MDLFAGSEGGREKERGVKGRLSDVLTLKIPPHMRSEAQGRKGGGQGGREERQVSTYLVCVRDPLLH